MFFSLGTYLAANTSQTFDMIDHNILYEFCHFGQGKTFGENQGKSYTLAYRLSRRNHVKSSENQGTFF